LGAGILGGMSTSDVEALRQVARLAAFDFSVAELEPIRFAVERALQALVRLEELPLGSVEPVTQFRMV
jgi:Asp-tRNA(Asn)/Glu-tRNA(Gln) amidotransferase C subunit